MSFPRPTQMFQFRRFPSYTYLIQYRIPCGGFPHSEISGSMLICSSPKLIAAYHVLHRLLMPRHSPCALFSLTQQKNPFLVSLVELCRLIKEVSLAKIVIITLLIKKVFLYCCLLIIASIIHNVQFSRCMLSFFFKRLNEASNFHQELQSISFFGGDQRDRTADLLLARQALSQLS